MTQGNPYSVFLKGWRIEERKVCILPSELSGDVARPSSSTDRPEAEDIVWEYIY